MQQQPPEWLTLFVAAYGTNGVIALAWWVGARHAAEIRERQGSFPFLHAVPTGRKPSMLLSTLSALSGSAEDPIIDAAACTHAALNRTLFADQSLPLVISELVMRGDTSFDWDSLNPLFNNCTLHIGRRFDSHPQIMKSPRGLVLLTPGISGPALQSRTVRLSIDQIGDSRQLEHAFQLRQQLELRSDALSLSPAAWSKLVNRMGETQVHIEALQGEVGRDLSLSNRQAKNHAQLIALVYALADIFYLPEEMRALTVREIHRMAYETADVQF